MRRCSFQRNTILLLAAAALWVYTGEVAIHHLYSLKWHWPELGLSRESLKREFTQMDPPRNPLSQPNAADHYHYQSGDNHYYVVPNSSEQGGARKGGGTGVRVLFVSDPHIMCTFQ